MAYDEDLAQLVRGALALAGATVEKKMFGGLCFLLRDHMVCGVLRDELILRLDPERAKYLIERGSVRPMDFTGRPMKGFVVVEPADLKSLKAVKDWLTESVQFVLKLPPKIKRQRPSRSADSPR